MQHFPTYLPLFTSFSGERVGLRSWYQWLFWNLELPGANLQAQPDRRLSTIVAIAGASEHYSEIDCSVSLNPSGLTRFQLH